MSRTKLSNFERINANLVIGLQKYDSAMLERILGQESGDIDGTFLGFVDTYYHLSKIIPLDWTIIDFGCASAPQAYYFRKHKKYIGVNPGNSERFTFENTEHQRQTIKEYLGNGGITDEKIFCICNYVPSAEVGLVKKGFKNVFVFYPE